MWGCLPGNFNENCSETSGAGSASFIDSTCHILKDSKCIPQKLRALAVQSGRSFREVTSKPVHICLVWFAAHVFPSSTCKIAVSAWAGTCIQSPPGSVNWLLMAQGAAMRLVLKVWLTRACTSITTWCSICKSQRTRPPTTAFAGKNVPTANLPNIK